MKRCGQAVTPAADYLFEVNDQPNLLNSEKTDFFHHMVAKLLFICKRGRPGIQTAVAFLCTQVKEPDEDDYKKLYFADFENGRCCKFSMVG